MSGFCGWLFPNKVAQIQITDIDKMAKKMVSPLTPNTKTMQGNGWAAAVCAKSVEQHLSQKDQLVFLLEGTPQRRDDKSMIDVHWLADRWLEQGEKVLPQISGKFAFAVLDTQAQTFFMATDQIGFCPLFFLQHPSGGIIFASTASAIQALSFAKQAINPQAIYEYLYSHMVPSPTSIYQNQQRLLAAESLNFDTKNGIKTQRYWQLIYQSEDNVAALEEELHETLRSAMKGALYDSKSAAFLSGGVDSSTVSGLYKALDEQARTYSIGFDADGFDETAFARETAAHFKTDHHEYYVTPQDVIDSIPKIAAFYDQPFGNASAIPAFACAKLARSEGVNVMFGGDGGDELFGGNERYMKQGVFEHYQKIPQILRSALFQPFSKIPVLTNIPPFSKVKSYIDQAQVPLPARLETYNFLHRRPLNEIFNADFMQQFDPQAFENKRDKFWQSANADSIVHKMLYFDQKYTLTDNDLPKVNRMCELAGVDIQYPLLDLDVIEFSARLSDKIMIKDGQLRWFFKHAMRDFLPQSTLTKSKQGFGLPFGLWSRENSQLHDMMNDAISDFSKRQWVNQTWLDWLRKNHNGEHASYYGVMLWVLMMLEYWLVAHA